MPTDLYFDLSDVLVLLEHARSCVEHGQSLSEQKHNRECPGGLEWVADTGVYLMSAGRPPLPGPTGSANLAVYAHGWGPQTPRRARADTDLGGDDFVEHLHLTDQEIDRLKAAHTAGARWLRLAVTTDQVRYCTTCSGPR